MSPREIEVRIDELVLHGFAPETRWRLAAALQGELHRLISEHGVPAAWQTSPDRLDAGGIPATPKTNVQTAGEQIARAVHRGPTR
jgi:hypothetical protein